MLELHCGGVNRGRRTRHVVWSGRRGSNPQPTAWEAATLPLSYSRSRLKLIIPTMRALFDFHFLRAHVSIVSRFLCNLLISTQPDSVWPPAALGAPETLREAL